MDDADRARRTQRPSQPTRPALTKERYAIHALTCYNYRWKCFTLSTFPKPSSQAQKMGWFLVIWGQIWSPSEIKICCFYILSLILASRARNQLNDHFCTVWGGFRGVFGFCPVGWPMWIRGNTFGGESQFLGDFLQDSRRLPKKGHFLAFFVCLSRRFRVGCGTARLGLHGRAYWGLKLCFFRRRWAC